MMHKFFRSASFRFLSLIIVFALALPAGVPAASSAAAPVPKLKHHEISGFVPGLRIRVEAKIEHGAALRAVRCYFRAKHEGDFTFVDLTSAEASEYQAFLPAPGSENLNFDYMFLVVDKDKRVYKSRLFKALGQTAKKGGLPFTTEDAPKWQTADQHPIVTIRHEVPNVAAPPKGLWADGHLRVVQVPPEERFGLTAHLYPQQRVAGLENTSGGRFEGEMDDSNGMLGLGPLAWTGIGVGAAAAVGALVAAGGGGGGGGGSSEPETPVEPPVGPDLNGEWNGQLRLVLEGTQAVSATITHQGNRVAITTSATSAVGRSFSGTITSGGEMRVRDGFDNELWTTHFEPATAHFVRIADFITPTDDRLNTLTLGR